jgi:hypothetical protein
VTDHHCYLRVRGNYLESELETLRGLRKIAVKVEDRNTANLGMVDIVVRTAEARKGAEVWVEEYLKVMVGEGVEVVIEVVDIS